MKKIITVWLAITVAIMFTSCKKLPQENSSTTLSDTSTITSIYSELTNNEETTSADETNSEPTPTVSKNESVASTPVPTPSVSKEDSNISSTETRKVVQLADPDTGISWDGVSPIIYTYPDGTTGTEKRDGATYEQVPGLIDTYTIPRDSVEREIGTICPVCQKEIQYLSGGKYCSQKKRCEYCIECGIYINAYTCHTCAQNFDYIFCRQCGKKGGDGRNGTCGSWLEDIDCPNCGEHVEAYTCHTCDE